MDFSALTGLFVNNNGSVVLNVLLSTALIWSIKQIANKEKVIQNYQKRDEENEKQLNEYNRTLVKLLIERGHAEKNLKMRRSSTSEAPRYIQKTRGKALPCGA